MTKFIFTIVMALTPFLAHATQDENSINCVLDLMAPKIAALDSSDETRVERVTPLNLAKAFAAAAVIFPGDKESVEKSYLASFIPRRILPPATRVSTSIRLERLEYYTLRDQKNGQVLGITGLYSVQHSGEAWIGWYGMTPAAI